LKYQDIFGSEITTTVSAGAVDAAGNVYLTGWTTSPSLPVTPRAFQTTFIQSQCGTNYYPGPNGGPEVSVPIPCAHAFIAKIAADGASLVYLTYLGGELTDYVNAIAVDAAGNAYLTGTTSSTTFPVTLLAYRSKPGSGFVTKLSADGSALLFSTYFDGVQGEAITFDASGNVYVAGGADGAKFDTTPGAFQSKGYLGHGDAFVFKLNPYGTRLLYSTLVGGTFDDWATSLAVDQQGNAYIAGITASVPAYAHLAGPEGFTPFPTKPGAYYHPGDRSDVFVTKINATGTALVYSVLMGGSAFDWLVGLVVDDAGSAYFAGYGTPDFPLTPGAFDSGYSGGFVGKLSADGSQLLYSTHLGGVRLNDAELAWVDSLGRAVVIGSSINNRFPTTPDSLIPCFPETDPSHYVPWPFVTEFNASGTALVYSSFLRRRPVAHDSSGNLYLPSDTAILDRININTPLPSGPRCVTNAASFWGTAVSPGEIVSLFGPSIGPDTPATIELDDAGRVSSRLSGIRVLFNAMPAPLLYVSKNQINAVVPFGVAGLSQVTIQIERNGASDMPPLHTTVVDAAPGVFSGPSGAAAINQDGTINSKEHPAERHSVVSIFLTGAGLMTPMPADGTVPKLPYSKIVLPVLIDGDAEILYAGDAPGLVEGVVQINFRLPELAGDGLTPLQVQIANYGDSGLPQIWIR